MRATLHVWSGPIAKCRLQDKQSEMCHNEWMKPKPRALPIDEFAVTLQQDVQPISFALLFGSAKDGLVAPESDLDIGVYLEEKSYDVISRILEVCESYFPDIRPDVSILNDASVILRFEALRGRTLFINDMATFAYFYSLTCREYEDEIWWRKRQLEYRGIECNTME
jgi:predicted nucleotidyltransferase